MIKEANDGVVPFSSARKSDDGWVYKGQWPVDHAGLVGWFDFDPGSDYYNAHIARYVALADYLAGL